MTKSTRKGDNTATKYEIFDQPTKTIYPLCIPNCHLFSHFLWSNK